jgi:hypothetical protein
VKGGIELFRASEAAARRYAESDRSVADDYYLGTDVPCAAWTVTDAAGEVVASANLDPEAYSAWVDWRHPLTGELMGTPRKAGESRKGSPRFADLIVNAPKSLSIAAAFEPPIPS